MDFDELLRQGKIKRIFCFALKANLGNRDPTAIIITDFRPRLKMVIQMQVRAQMLIHFPQGRHKVSDACGMY